MKREKAEKILIAGAALLLSAQSSMAQDMNKAFSALDGVTNGLKSNFSKVYTLVIIIGAVVGIIGAIQVYSKWQSNDTNTTKLAGAWFGSALFLIAAGVFLKTAFGIT
jgi:hypothetical protein